MKLNSIRRLAGLAAGLTTAGTIVAGPLAAPASAADPCGYFTNWAGRAYYNVCTQEGRYLQINISHQSCSSNGGCSTFYRTACWANGTHYLGWNWTYPSGAYDYYSAYWDGYRC